MDDDTWLGLLADLDEGVSPATFAADLTAASLPAPLVERLLSIHEKVEGSRRREDLLRVLHDTATDLTGIRDVEAVLQAIVARTRQLVGSDMAYLSFNDHATGETYIRKSDGVVTPEYRSIRMPLGTGVLGSIATGHSSVSVVDYLAEPGIVHLPDIDAIVRAEGVRAIMGVPLTVHGRVLGALLVAERTRRRFRAEEIDLVDSIGKQAAVALDNAQRFAEVTESLARLGAERHQNATELAAVQALVDLDERLLEVVVRGWGYDELLAAGSSALPFDMVIRHADGRVLGAHSAAASRLRPGAEVPDAARWFEALPPAALADLERTERTASVTGHAQPVRGKARAWPYTVAAALAGTETLATVVVGAELTAEQRPILERLALFCAVTRLFGRAAQAAESAQQAELVDNLMAGRITDPEVVDRHLARFRLEAGNGVTVALVHLADPDPAARVRAALGGQPALVAEHSGHACVVVQDADAIASLSEQLGTPARITHATASGTRTIVAAHQLASFAAEMLAELGRWTTLDATTMGAAGAIVAAHRGAVDHVLAPIRPLVEHDDRHGTALVRTAASYLDCDASIARAAAALFVHRNTVTQRLARIADLIGADWCASPRRLDVHLALRVWLMASGSATEVR